MKKKLPLIIALVFGAAALFSIRSYVNQVRDEAAKSQKMVQVIGSRLAIPAGTELTPEMLYPMPFPAKHLPAQAIQRQSDIKLIVGRRTAVRLEPNQILLWSDLAGDTDRGGFSTVIPSGERAYTVTISKGVRPGLVQNGDHIDIMATFSLPKEERGAGQVASWRLGSDMVNVVLLQNVTVLAVGDSYSESGRGDSGGGTDLTLSLTLQEAQSLMFASQHGELGATLRRDGSVDVKTREELPRVTFGDVEKIIGDLDLKRASRVVEVQKGVRTEQYPVLPNGSAPVGSVPGGVR